MQSVETNFTDVPEQTSGLKKVAQNTPAAVKWHPKPRFKISAQLNASSGAMSH